MTLLTVNKKEGIRKKERIWRGSVVISFVTVEWRQPAGFLYGLGLSELAQNGKNLVWALWSLGWT